MSGAGKSMRRACLWAAALAAAGGAIALAATAGTDDAGRLTRTDGLIAFAVEVGNHSYAYVVRADGTGRRRLTNGDAGCPEWSPDGRRIALLGPAGIEVLTTAGERQWGLSIADPGCPVWSPDGSRLAFLRYGDKGVDLEVVGANGHGLHKLAAVYTPTLGYRPVWSADGKEIVFIPTLMQPGRPALAVVRADGSRRRVLRLKPDPAWCQTTCWVIAPLAWAPGRQIAFVMIGGDAGPGHVYSVGADGRGQHLLSGPLDENRDPAWSPDGHHIAFASDVHDDQQIWTADPSGNGLRKVSRIRSVSPTETSGVFPATWSPDGNQFACFGLGGGLYVVDARGGNARLVVRRVEPYGAIPPSWQPRR